MEELEIPYGLHDEIEKYAFNNTRKQILQLSLSAEQKVGLMEWLNDNF